MKDELSYTIKLENNAPIVRAELEKDIERALYAIGVKAVEGAVTSISGDYNKANQAVDTGRLRASISFITASGDMDKVPDGMPAMMKSVQTPKEGSSVEKNPLKQEDLLTGTAPKNSVIIGSNVEYAEYVHNTTRTTKDGKVIPARPFLREGIDRTKAEMEQQVKGILEGKY